MFISVVMSHASSVALLMVMLICLLVTGPVFQTHLNSFISQVS